MCHPMLVHCWCTTTRISLRGIASRAGNGVVPQVGDVTDGFSRGGVDDLHPAAVTLTRAAFLLAVASSRPRRAAACSPHRLTFRSWTLWPPTIRHALCAGDGGEEEASVHRRGARGRRRSSTRRLSAPRDFRAEIDLARKTLDDIDAAAAALSRVHERDDLGNPMPQGARLLAQGWSSAVHARTTRARLAVRNSWAATSPTAPRGLGAARPPASAGSTQ